MAMTTARDEPFGRPSDVRRPIVEITIARHDDGSAQSAEEAIEAVREALQRDPPDPGSVFLFLGMTFESPERLFDAIRALQPLWE